MSFRAREDVAHHILKQHPGKALSNNRSQQPSKSSSAPQHEQKQMVNAPEEVNDHDNEGKGYNLNITMWFSLFIITNLQNNTDIFKYL